LSGKHFTVATLMVLTLTLCMPVLSAAKPTNTIPQVDKPLHHQLDQVDEILSGMKLQEKIGQLFLIAADGDLEDTIRTYEPGGFILFSRHTPTITRTMHRIERLRHSTRLPPFIAVDQEGGRVSRLPFATAVPDARSLQNLPESALLKIGRLVGQELRALGFTINFAPVLDVDTCQENPVIGNRSFSQDPYLVARLGTSYIRGLRSAGIASTAKHFPGHGDSSSDSHLVLPVVAQSEERISSVELLPFRAAIKDNVDLIMMAHVSYPSLDSATNVPGSLSRPITTGILRNELGYKGVIITDAMNMKAITTIKDSGQAAISAFQAGADIILMPEDFPAAYLALLSSVENNEISRSRVDESVRRILALKLRLSDPIMQPFEIRLKNALETVGSSNHRRWLDQILNGNDPAAEPPK